MDWLLRGVNTLPVPFLYERMPNRSVLLSSTPKKHPFNYVISQHKIN